MADTFVIDFKHLLWGLTKVGWRHENADAYEALRSTLSGTGERISLVLPASATNHLEGLVTVDSIQTKAKIEVTGLQDSPSLSPEMLGVMNAGGFTKLLFGHALTFEGEDGRVVITLISDHHEKPEQRIDHFIRTLADLQFVALKVLVNTFGIHDDARVALPETL